MLKQAKVLKSFIKKPVKVNAIQLTQDMIDFNMPPGESYLKDGKFFVMTLEGTISADVGAWYVEGQEPNDIWFIQDYLFKRNYVEIDKSVPVICVFNENDWAIEKIQKFIKKWVKLLKEFN